ncbi:MAG: hypothetical protein WA704_19210, partial [Pseudolabrys sp.]
AFEDAIDVACCLPELVEDINAIGILPIRASALFASQTSLRPDSNSESMCARNHAPHFGVDP